MRVLYRENPRALVVYSETHSLIIQQLKKQKASVAVELISNEQIKKENGFKVLIKKDVYGCLGFINIDNQIFLAVITGALTDVAHPVEYESVDRIFSVDFISLSSDEWDFVNLDTNGMPIPSNSNVSSDEINDYARSVHPCQDLKKLLSNGSFYYSGNFDLTSLLQNRGINNKKLLQEGYDDGVRKMHVEHYQKDYMWNSFMMDELINFRSNLDPYLQSIMDANGFLTTVIRGFAKTTRLNSAGDTISIISKQSWRRAGTRFNARGIDDNGFVANFVETEFIFNNPSKSSLFSFVQIRGSVPTFWEQDSTLINPKITLTRSLGATQPVFNKHISDICNKYGVCHIINLLSKTKSAEVAVSRRYQELYANSDYVKEVEFTNFDFHHETKPSSGGFAGATKILPMLHESLEQFGWMYYDSEHGEMCTRQNGVFRTNCLDCLDRTNLIQQVISSFVLENILKSQIRGPGDGYRDRARIEDILNKHNAMWADHGDSISQIYTGTNALKSSFSRSGKMNIAGALSDVTKSVSRMYQNTFVDGKKQSTMDLLLGYDARNSTKVRIYDPINEHVASRLKSNASLFTTWNDITIFVGTYNLNALDPDLVKTDLSPWLFPPDNQDFEMPDIYSIGLQEIIELNAGSILNADATRPAKWASIISKQLNQHGEQYLLLRTESMSSMCMFLFVKKSQVHHVTQVAGSSKKTGLGGMTANKGACAVRFEYGSTSFVLITSHLAAGTNATTERHNDYMTIMQGLTFVRNMTIRDHDHIIWFGDLNYRIALPNDHCRSLIDHGAFDELLAVDQLNKEIVQRGAFQGFKEGAIKFYPTYKFDKGTSNYDSSEKQRVPSWTDRILYRSAKGLDGLKQLNYNSSMEILVSDHKPVFSTLQSKVEFVDREKKKKLFKSLYESYKAENGNDETSLLELDSNSVNSKTSASSANSTFTIDTLSEMNIMDDDFGPSTGAKTLTRTGSSNTPRRIPPPPPNGRKQGIENFSYAQQKVPRKLPPPPDSYANSAAPPPPPPRKSNSQLVNKTSEPAKPPIGFSSTPLIPSRSSSSTPFNGSPIISPNHTSQDIVKPMIPSKPSSLTSNKTSKQDENSSINNSVTPKIEGPKPPPSRTNKTAAQSNSTTPSGSMSDWKPLVPK